MYNVEDVRGTPVQKTLAYTESNHPNREVWVVNTMETSNTTCSEVLGACES